MIVVSIIGILASIAIPNMRNAQLKAKRVEIVGALGSIKTMEQAYDAAHDQFVDAAVQPRADSALDKTAVSWTGSASTGFSRIGWSPDGNVRGNYQVFGATDTDFSAEAHIDADGDGVLCIVAASNFVHGEITAAMADVY